MGAGASAAQTPVAGDHQLAVGADQTAPDRQSPARRQGLDLGATLAGTVSHFFPDLFQWLGEAGGKRDQEAVTYGRRFLIWMGLMLFLLKLGPRRRLRFELDTPEALADPKASKQDCEPKAFARPAQRLKKNYPQLSPCLCFDGLYANGTAMQICHENHWKYIITFKEESLPALWREYQSLLALCPQNRKVHATDQGVRQTFAWVQPLEHVDDQRRRRRLNAFQRQEQRDGQPHFFAWLTNFSVNADSVATPGNRGGRCRWKIENEGFNLQKNGGFNLEHAYSIGSLQIKNFYVLLQIAHLILQLVERGSLLTRKAKQLFGSLANLARRLAESICNVAIAAAAIDPSQAAKIQIRLETS